MKVKSFDALLACIGLDREFWKAIMDAQSTLVAELAERRRETSMTSKGALTIKLDFTFSREGPVDVKGSFEVKTPKPPAQRGTLFLDPDGKSLTMQNPNQATMDFSGHGSRGPTVIESVPSRTMDTGD